MVFLFTPHCINNEKRKNIFEAHLPSSQSHILFLLEQNGRKKMSNLVDVLYLTPTTVTTALDKLLKNGDYARLHDKGCVQSRIRN